MAVPVYHEPETVRPNTKIRVTDTTSIRDAVLGPGVSPYGTYVDRLPEGDHVRFFLEGRSTQPEEGLVHFWGDDLVDRLGRIGAVSAFQQTRCQAAALLIKSYPSRLAMFGAMGSRLLALTDPAQTLPEREAACEAAWDERGDASECQDRWTLQLLRRVTARSLTGAFAVALADGSSPYFRVLWGPCARELTKTLMDTVDAPDVYTFPLNWVEAMTYPGPALVESVTLTMPDGSTATANKYLAGCIDITFPDDTGEPQDESVAVDFEELASDAPGLFELVCWMNSSTRRKSVVDLFGSLDARWAQRGYSVAVRSGGVLADMLAGIGNGTVCDAWEDLPCTTREDLAEYAKQLTSCEPTFFRDDFGTSPSQGTYWLSEPRAAAARRGASEHSLRLDPSTTASLQASLLAALAAAGAP